MKTAPRQPDELVIISKVYDLVLWSCLHIGKFPRNHRFVLGERLEQRLYELLETLITAKYTRERAALLKQANLTIEILRFQMRLAKDLQCLPTNSFGHAIRQLDEIGRMVGGWARPKNPGTAEAP
jgi:hypothetical protein